MKNNLKAIFALLFISVCPFFSRAQTKPQAMPDMRGYTLVYKAIQAHDREQYDSAIALFNWVHPSDSAYSWAVAEKANTLYEAGRYEEVIALCEEALKEPIGHHGYIYMTLGSAYDELEQTDKALDAYTRGIADSPMLERIHFNKAVTHIRRSEFQLAYESLKRALTINPFHAGSHYLLGVLALEQGELVPATLAMGTYLMLEPTAERSLDGLAALNDGLSEKQELKNHGINFGEDFSKLNLLVRNYAALRDSYKTPSQFTLPVVKQAHLIFNQLKPDKDGWISNFYSAFYKAVVADEKLFEGWSYLIMVPSTSENHQKIISTNIAKVKKFIEWAEVNWETQHAYVTDTLQGKTTEVRYLRRDNHSLEAVGEWDKTTDKPNGYLRIYDNNGTLSSHGNFNKQGQRSGLWYWYYDNGRLREEQAYKNDQPDGPGSFYDRQGALAVTQEWANGKRHGTRKTYHANGVVMSEVSYTNDVMNGSYKSYYPQGQLEYEVPLVEDKQSGTGTAYNADGSKSTIAVYANGMLNGPYVRYNSNGEPSEESTYANDLAEGNYKTYYPDGQLKTEGQWVKGQRVGKWTNYYPNGDIDFVEEYDAAGKMNGTYQDFDQDGRRVNEIEYKNGEVIAHRYFDLDGKLIAEQKAKKGKLPFKAYHSNRQIAAEGDFVDGQKQGLWVYYNEYGFKTSAETFNAGKLTGTDTEFYADEKLRSITRFSGDVRQGLYQEFYHDSTLAMQGRYANGVQEGPWYNYSPDGSLLSLQFYTNGKLNGWQKYFTTTGVLWRENYMREGLLLGYRFYGPLGEVLGEGMLANGTGTISWKYPNGQVAMRTEVKNGQLHGKTELFYPSGKVKMTGQNAFNGSTGQWVWYFEDGKKEAIGSFKDDVRDGQWRWFYENGQPNSIANYQLGSMVGQRKDYNREGMLLMLGNFLMDELHGPRYSFGADSTVCLVRNYRFGVVADYTWPDKNGTLLPAKPLVNGTADVQTFYPNGVLAQKFSYRFGQFDGVYERYLQTGKLIHKSTNLAGLDNGPILDYYASGLLAEETNNVLNFKHGKSRLYHTNGKLYRDENYVYDQREGEALEYDESGKLIRTEFWFNGNLYSVE